MQQEGPDWARATADWHAPGTGGSELWVHFRPVRENPSTTEIADARAIVALPAGSAKASTARLWVDGQDSGFAFDVSRVKLSRGILTIAREGERAAVVERMIGATSAEVELRDGSGRPLGRAAFDVLKLRRIPELLELVKWSCTSPDRG